MGGNLMGILETTTAVLLANILTVFFLTFVQMVNCKLAQRKQSIPTQKV